MHSTLCQPSCVCCCLCSEALPQTSCAQFDVGSVGVGGPMVIPVGALQVCVPARLGATSAHQQDSKCMHTESLCAPALFAAPQHAAAVLWGACAGLGGACLDTCACPAQVGLTVAVMFLPAYLAAHLGDEEYAAGGKASDSAAVNGHNGHSRQAVPDGAEPGHNHV